MFSLLNICTCNWGRLWPSAIIRLTAHFTCGLYLIWWFASIGKSVVKHDTECPYWDQMSLNNTQAQTKWWYMLRYMRSLNMFCLLWTVVVPDTWWSVHENCNQYLLMLHNSFWEIMFLCHISSVCLYQQKTDNIHIRWPALNLRHGRIRAFTILYWGWTREFYLYTFNMYVLSEVQVPNGSVDKTSFSLTWNILITIQMSRVQTQVGSSLRWIVLLSHISETSQNQNSGFQSWGFFIYL